MVQINKLYNDEIDYLEWLLEHKGKGYTKEFYENNIEARINKLKSLNNKILKQYEMQKT
jgi:hypothetical protein